MEKIYGVREGRPDKLPNNTVVKNQNDIAKELDTSVDQLQNYKKLLTLIPELQELIEKDKLSATAGYKVLARWSV